MFRKLLRALNSPKPILLASRRDRRRLTFEALECRRLMAAHLNTQPVDAPAASIAEPAEYGPAIEYNAQTRTLTLNGDGEANHASARIDTHNNSISSDDEIVVSITRANESFSQRFALY